ncbi:MULTISPECIES: hypothetical protein [Pseudomonas]|uniref:Uncharacterized protein n=2 Tax=Pseudomonas TaxID=286 RepID=A0A7M2JC80_PSEFL|nr:MULTISPECIES: hypothetical protein [Pseudomonas]PMX29052.1 hypothetical protein C1Y24_32760 [Pseudomonas sp. MPR-R2A4]PMX46774.1 hypothetical protein C1Y17_32480 [Pseudomonas sp. MPR-R2A6]PMX81731.1 hypothetical protein C1Y21_32160 [Pseudomonas sp. MPR-R2A3]PMY04827.1 hypothetical protein C1Y22_32300 [Pseudomonas sp. MPR-R2A5]PNA18387.1 hypothetical protein C1Y16_34885 [Pseudomonas sp. MPR-ANB1]
MEYQKIQVIRNNIKIETTVKYDPVNRLMWFSESNNFRKLYQGKDIYVCLAKVRAEFPHMTFLCKGAKINVMPSRMASQMSAGLVAYEMTLGKHADQDNIVHLFDYEENNLTNDPQVQIDFFKTWLASIGAKDYEKLN